MIKALLYDLWVMPRMFLRQVWDEWRYRAKHLP